MRPLSLLQCLTRVVLPAAGNGRYLTWGDQARLRDAAGARYVLLSTDEDCNLNTLDNKPFKRPLQALAVNEAGMRNHAHGEQGACELAIVR